MPRSTSWPLLPLVILLAMACGGNQEQGGNPGVAAAPKPKATRAGKRSGFQRPGLREEATVTDTTSVRTGARNDRPFVEMQGYIVKGTDESSFRRCGSSRVYFTRVASQAASRVGQHIRWSTRQPYDPAYVVVRARLVDDTVTVGTNRYTAVVEISQIDLERSKGTPVCPRPPRGSMLASR